MSANTSSSRGMRFYPLATATPTTTRGVDAGGGRHVRKHALGPREALHARRSHSGLGGEGCGELKQLLSCVVDTIVVEGRDHIQPHFFVPGVLAVFP
jgi:hypothetical protein